MIRQFCAAVVVGSAAWAESPPYVPYSGIIHGTEGAVAVVLTIQNDTGADLVCRAALAHWYSVDLGVAVVGEVVQLTLWHDPATGRLDLLNETRHRMPVEAIWCGLSPNVHDTRGRVNLPFVTNTLLARLERRCNLGAAGRVVCVVPDD